MRNRFPRLAVLTIIVALVGACAIVPVGRGHDDGYGAAIAVSPAVIAAPFLFWGLRTAGNMAIATGGSGGTAAVDEAMAAVVGAAATTSTG